MKTPAPAAKKAVVKRPTAARPPRCCAKSRSKARPCRPKSIGYATASCKTVARTPPSEILLTIQAVKQMQVELSSLAQVVEAIGERLARLETRLDAPKKG